MQITQILNSNYEELDISRPLISKRLSEIAIFGSFYQAQEMLLKPVIEKLIEDGVDAFKVFNYLKENLFSARAGASWFNSWTFGKEILKDGITRYFGIPHSKWERILIEDWTYDKIENEFGLTENNIKKVFREMFNGKDKARKSLRISRTLELIKQGWSFERIYKEDFKGTGKEASMNSHFAKNLFKGFSGINRSWKLEEIRAFALSGILPE